MKLLTLIIPKRGNDEMFIELLRSIKRWQSKSRNADLVNILILENSENLKRSERNINLIKYLIKDLKNTEIQYKRRFLTMTQNWSRAFTENKITTTYITYVTVDSVISSIGLDNIINQVINNFSIPDIVVFNSCLIHEIKNKYFVNVSKKIPANKKNIKSLNINKLIFDLKNYNGDLRECPRGLNCIFKPQLLGQEVLSENCPDFSIATRLLSNTNNIFYSYGNLTIDFFKEKKKGTGGSYKFKEPPNHIKNDFKWHKNTVLQTVTLECLYFTLFEDFRRNISRIKPSKLNYYKYVARDLGQKLIFKRLVKELFLVGEIIGPINTFFHFSKGIMIRIYWFVFKKNNLIQRIIYKFKFNNFSSLNNAIEFIDNLNK